MEHTVILVYNIKCIKVEKVHVLGMNSKLNPRTRVFLGVIGAMKSVFFETLLSGLPPVRSINLILQLPPVFLIGL